LTYFSLFLFIKPLSEEILSELRDALFDAFDNNRDGKISVDEMAEILQPEENFKLIFKKDNCDNSTAEFIKVFSLVNSSPCGLEFNYFNFKRLGENLTWINQVLLSSMNS
jgi:Ca2+-binding EF-hand superfamily protein